MRKPKLSAICILCAMGTAQAQSPASLPSYDQSGAMSEEADGSRPDSVNNLTIVQPSALANRIERARQTAGGTQSESADADDSAASQQTGERQRINGFRIQVFSDNNQKTSQREAKAKERRLNERFPEYETYIVYNSPYWRLKVGDFRTEFDAEAAADEIKRAFPEFAREVRIVRDRISTGR